MMNKSVFYTLQISPVITDRLRKNKTLGCPGRDPMIREPCDSGCTRQRLFELHHHAPIHSLTLTECSSSAAVSDARMLAVGIRSGGTVTDCTRSACLPTIASCQCLECQNVENRSKHHQSLTEGSQNSEKSE